jgi:hypothetical protein
VSLTAGAFTGTLDFTNGGSPLNMTFTRNDGSTALSLSGTGARKLLLGSGTFTFNGPSGALFDIGTTTNLDPNSVLTVGLTFTATTASERQLNGGGQTLGALVISANTSRGGFRIFGANTYSSWSFGCWYDASATIGHANHHSRWLYRNGLVIQPDLDLTGRDITGTATISFSNAATADWVSLVDITTTGAGSFTGTNGLNFGRVTLDSGDSLTGPSGGVTYVGVIGS